MLLAFINLCSNNIYTHAHNDENVYQKLGYVNPNWDKILFFLVRSKILFKKGT